MESLSQSSRENIRFLYDSEDLYETCINIKNHNHLINNIYNTHWLYTIKMKIKPYSFDELIKRYKELSINYMQFGLDETNYVLGTKFAVQRHEEGMNILQLFNTNININEITICPNVLLARKYLRRGCPPSLRFI